MKEVKEIGDKNKQHYQHGHIRLDEDADCSICSEQIPKFFNVARLPLFPRR
jgi:hypothetical protein